MAQDVGMQPPAPPPETVTASRRHLTVHYAQGLDRLLWETEKRAMPDADAVRAMICGSLSAGPADALDITAGLVMIQAMRLELDALEADVLDAARASGVSAEAVAAALEFPDTASVASRHEMLSARRAAPRAPARPAPEEPRAGAQSAVGGAAEHPSRRARRAADRAAQARRRHAELTGKPKLPGMVPGQAAAPPLEEDTRQIRITQASANVSAARLNARESAERVALGLLRAADALERCAARCDEWADKLPGADEQAVQRQRAAEYLRSARTYREMAGTYRGIGRHLPTP